MALLGWLLNMDMGGGLDAVTLIRQQTGSMNIVLECEPGTKYRLRQQVTGGTTVYTAAEGVRLKVIGKEY